MLAANLMVDIIYSMQSVINTKNLSAVSTSPSRGNQVDGFRALAGL